MERIEKNVLGAEDKNAIIFKTSFFSSINMIALAVSLSITHSPNWILKSQYCAYPQQGAIIADAALIALPLNGISSAHWTAKPVFMASFTAGVFSVFFSYAVRRKINGLHGSEDVRNWLSRPMTQVEARLLNEWLSRPGVVCTLQNPISPLLPSKRLDTLLYMTGSQSLIPETPRSGLRSIPPYCSQLPPIFLTLHLPLCHRPGDSSGIRVHGPFNTDSWNGWLTRYPHLLYCFCRSEPCSVLPLCNNEATRVRSNQAVDERDTLHGTSAFQLPQ